MTDPDRCRPQQPGPGGCDQARSSGYGGGALAGGAAARGLSGLGSFLNRKLGGPGPRPRCASRSSGSRCRSRSAAKAERDAMLAAAAENVDKEAAFAKLAEESASTAADRRLLRHARRGTPAGSRAISAAGASRAVRGRSRGPGRRRSAAVGGGLYGGWKLTDYLLDKTEERGAGERAGGGPQGLRGRPGRPPQGGVGSPPRSTAWPTSTRSGPWAPSDGRGPDGRRPHGSLGSPASAPTTGPGRWPRTRPSRRRCGGGRPRSPSSPRVRSWRSRRRCRSCTSTSRTGTTWRGASASTSATRTKEPVRQKTANIGQAADQFLSRISPTRWPSGSG